MVVYQTKGEVNMELSVIIVSYNTKDLLQNCLKSIFEQTKEIGFDVWVVDNDSSDGSADMVEAKFPLVNLIRNPVNGGFAQANNLVLKQCTGDYVLILNPDTIIPENTFKKVIDFLQQHSDAGAVGCKLIKADGRLDIACKSGFPTPWNSFCKATGLDRLFPKSKFFGGYNLTYLDENETHAVDCLVGAFMMLPRTVMEQVGYLDEAFFMYGEDIDWCYRIKKAGYSIYYYPGTYIWHYKRESSKKESTKTIRYFHKAMYIYYNKHFRRKYPVLLSWLVYIGIYAKWGLAIVINAIKRK